MSTIKWICLFAALGVISTLTSRASERVGGENSRDTISLRPNYVTKLKCQGKLLVSAIGNSDLVQLEQYPRELGCGVILKPLVSQGRSNLLLETTSGTVSKIIEIGQARIQPSSSELTIVVQKGER